MQLKPKHRSERPVKQLNVQEMTGASGERCEWQRPNVWPAEKVLQESCPRPRQAMAQQDF
jgi:hypothetical protein